MQNATAMPKDIANYVKHSQKRQRSFEAFCIMEDIELSNSLRPLCMTRRLCSKSSLDSLVNNYDALLQWFYELTLSGSSEEKAAGLAYTIKLTKFINYYSIQLLQKVFSLMHYTHKEIQKPSHSINEVRTMIDNLVKIFKAELTDEQASNFFHECCHEGSDVDDGGLGLEEPEAPRVWLRNERLENFHNPTRCRVGIRPGTKEEILEYHMKIYMEVMRNIVQAFEERFEIDPVVSAMESYLAFTQISPYTAGEPSCDSGNLVAVTRLIQDNSLGEVTIQGLIGDLRRIRNYEKVSNITHSTSPSAIAKTISSNTSLVATLPDFVHTLRLLLLIPATTCSAERSFSSLRRLKTYLRNNMTPSRLNNLAVLNIHKDVTDSLELGILVDKWRTGYTSRENAVASCHKWMNWRKMQKYNNGTESFLYIIYQIREFTS